MISRTPYIIKKYYHQLVWKIPTEKNELYLTFDDGPTPGVTDVVLQMLRESNSKATFFCVGKNVEKHPDLFRSILAEGHTVGNHTYQHLNGWKTSDSDYIEDVEKCEKTFTSKLFRPPYGKIKKSQLKKLDSYKIIMWSIITRDYDNKISKKKCLRIAKSGLKKGSILVFHDSEKAKYNMLYALNNLLSEMDKRGLTSASIKTN